jgi:hypothetical protein
MNNYQKLLLVYKIMVVLAALSFAIVVGFAVAVLSGGTGI